MLAKIKQFNYLIKKIVQIHQTTIIIIKLSLAYEITSKNNKKYLKSKKEKKAKQAKKEET